MTADLIPPPSKFRRHQPESGRAFAERSLFEEMEDAADLLQSKEDYGRASAMAALRACHSFLHVRGLSGQALKPLADLLGALEAVGKGTLPEMFDPTLRAGELPDRKWSRSPAAAETKAYAAACMDALMKCGASKDAARRRVARYADKWPRVSGGAIKPTTVANWLDELLQDGSDSRERKLFEGLSEAFCQRNDFLEHVLRDGPAFTGGVRSASKT